MTDRLPFQRDGAHGEFVDLYRSVAPVVRGYVARTVGPDLADDVVSEAFTAVFRRWDDAPTADDDRRAWVFGVARRSMWTVVRRERSARRPRSTAHAQEAVPDHADDVAGDDRAERLLAQLPPREREAIRLTVWQGLTPREAARLLGCTDVAMRQRLARAHSRLQGLLAAERQLGEGVSRVR